MSHNFAPALEGGVGGQGGVGGPGGNGAPSGRRWGKLTFLAFILHSKASAQRFLFLPLPKEQTAAKSKASLLSSWLRVCMYVYM